MLRSLAIPLAVFALLGALLFAGALDHPFHYDDRHSIEYNKHLRSLDNIPSFFTDPGTFSSERRGTMFRPLLLSSYALNYAVHQDRVAGYRIVNLAIHVLCSLALFALIDQGGRGRRVAWALGLVFLLHPVHAEPIYYISSRSDLLVGLFYLLALAAYCGRPAASWVAYGAGLLTKSVAITLPVVLGLWTWARGGLARLSNRYFAGLLLLSAIYVATITLNRFLTSSLSKAPRSFDVQLWTQIKALVYYIWLFFMPGTLSVEHPFSVADQWADPVVVCAFMALASLAYIVVVGRRRIAAWGLAFFVVALMPATLMPLNILVSERRIYLASAGLALVAVWAWEQLAVRRRGPGLVLGIGVCLALAAMGWARNPVWADDIALWEDAVAKGPGMYRARANLGLAYGRADRWQEAIVQLEQALQIKPDYADAWVELGNIYHELGQLDASDRAYRRALALNPGLEGVYYNLGNISLARGAVGQAIGFYRHTLEINPDFTDAYNNLGQALEQNGRLGEALDLYETAVRQVPDFGGAWFNLARMREETGQLDQALEAYGRARDLLRESAEFQEFADRAQRAAIRLERQLGNN